MAGIRSRAGAVALAALSVGALSLAFPTGGAAQDMPCRSARVIVPWGAGGGTDIVARILVDGANRIGADPQLQVVNVTGQGGASGAKEAQSADPDGCTLFFQHAALVTAHLAGRLDFSWDAFVPVARMAYEPHILGAHPDTPYDDLKELQEYAQTNPGDVLAAASLGSDTHFYMLQTQEQLGADFKIVPYEGGRERTTALLAHNVDLGHINESSAGQYLRDGELKALAYLYGERSPGLPDIPTAKEQGFDMEMGAAFGFLLPGGASQEVVDYYTELFRKTAADPKVEEQIRAKGMFPEFIPGEAYADWWRRTEEGWTEVAKRLGVTTAN